MLIECDISGNIESVGGWTVALLAFLGWRVPKKDIFVCFGI